MRQAGQRPPSVVPKSALRGHDSPNTPVSVASAWPCVGDLRALSGSNPVGLTLKPLMSRSFCAIVVRVAHIWPTGRPRHRRACPGRHCALVWRFVTVD